MPSGVNSKIDIIKHGLVVLESSSALQRPRPSLFTFPGLLSKPFWDIGDFPGHTQEALFCLQKNVSLMEEEISRNNTSNNDYRLQDSEHKLHQGQWSWNSFIQKGIWQNDSSIKFRETSKLLRQMGDDLMTGIPFGYSFISTLAPRSKIAPHYGPMNLRVRGHLGLICDADNEKMGIKVAGETRHWRKGELLLFDDSYLHATWNESSNKERVILLFDLWHPGLAAQEKVLLQEMFQQRKS